MSTVSIIEVSKLLSRLRNSAFSRIENIPTNVGHKH